MDMLSRQARQYLTDLKRNGILVFFAPYDEEDPVLQELIDGGFCMKDSERSDDRLAMYAPLA